MAKFNEKLQELNITEEQLSKGLREKISTYKVAADSLKTAKADGADEETLSDAKNDLAKLDEKLVKSIEQWFKNKDAQAERMKKRMEEKKSGKTDMKDDESDFQDDEEEQRRLQEQKRIEYLRRKAEFQRMQQQQQQNQQVQEPKKKGGKGVWILVGLVAVVTFGAVILKDK